VRRIGTIEGEAAARSFTDYLLTQRIRAQLRGSGPSQDVWVEDEEHLDKARSELDLFLRSSGDERYRKASDAAGALRRQAAADDELRRRNYVDLRTRWHIDRTSVPALASTLIGICFLVAAFTRMGGQLEPYGDRLLLAEILRDGGKIYWDGLSSIWEGHQYWRLITPIFLHFGALHILFNMWWLFDLGGMIEREKGSLTLAGLVLITGILGNLSEYAWSEHPMFGGMSGVTYGLFGYLWYVGPRERNPRLGIDIETTQLMALWLVLCMTGIMGDIANAAHLGGLVAGIAWGFLSIKLGAFKQRR
jgi:GlpG protein